MTNFIFHIGPIKTGSTSIQSFLEQQQSASPVLAYKRIPPRWFFGLAASETRKDSFQYFRNLYQRKLRSKKRISTLVLSHECMYQRPECIPFLIDTIDKIANKTCFIAYIRRQSRHYCSHFSQFLYFDLGMQRKIEKCFTENSLLIENYTGLEAFLISLVISDFNVVKRGKSAEYQDWTRMIEIDQSLRAKACHLDLGLIPSRQHDVNLIEDFCKRTGINNFLELSAIRDVRIHGSLPDVAVELLYQAYREGFKISAKKPEHLSCYKAFRRQEFRNNSLKIHDPDLIEELLDYIDNHYVEANNQVCRYFGLSNEYFTPKRYVDKKSASRVIKNIDQNRRNNHSERIQLKNKILCECARYFTINSISQLSTKN